MSQTLANIAVVAATIGTMTFLVPQIVKLIRTKDSSGVSSTWPALGFVINVGWFVYMIHNQHWVAVFAPLVTFISYAVILWALSRSGRILSASYVRATVWTVLLVGVTVIYGWVVLGVILGISYAVQLTPSIWTAYQTSDPSGVSPATWWIGSAEAALWGVFGLFHADRGIITFAIVGLIGSTLMLIRYYSTRRQVTPVTA